MPVILRSRGVANQRRQVARVARSQTTAELAGGGAGRRSAEFAMVEEEKVARVHASDGRTQTEQFAIADQRRTPEETLLVMACDPAPTLAVQGINRLPYQAGEESSATRGVKQSGRIHAAK